MTPPTRRPVTSTTSSASAPRPATSRRRRPETFEHHVSTAPGRRHRQQRRRTSVGSLRIRRVTRPLPRRPLRRPPARRAWRSTTSRVLLTCRPTPTRPSSTSPASSRPSTAATVSGCSPRRPTPTSRPARASTCSAAPASRVGDSVTVTGDVSEYRPAAAGLSLTELVDAAGHQARLGRDRADHHDRRARRPRAPDRLHRGRLPRLRRRTRPRSTPPRTASTSGSPWRACGSASRTPGSPVPRPGSARSPSSPAGAEPMTTRGGIAVQDNPGTTVDDMNPERVYVDDVLVDTPVTSTGDRFAGLTEGVLDYSFNAWKLLATTEPDPRPGQPPAGDHDGRPRRRAVGGVVQRGEPVARRTARRSSTRSPSRSSATWPRPT